MIVPLSPMDDHETAAASQKEDSTSTRPKRNYMERRNSIYEYFPVLKKSK